MINPNDSGPEVRLDPDEKEAFEELQLHLIADGFVDRSEAIQDAAYAAEKLGEEASKSLRLGALLGVATGAYAVLVRNVHDVQLHFGSTVYHEQAAPQLLTLGGIAMTAVALGEGLWTARKAKKHVRVLEEE